MGAVAWASLIPIAAWTSSRGALDGQSDLPTTLVYAVGAVVCHQRPERSFAWGNAPLPVCARCTGIYLAAALVALLVPLMPRGRVLGNQAAGEQTSDDVRPAWADTTRLAAAIAVTPTVLTLAWEWTLHEMPSNGVRAAAGIPIGAFVSWVVLRGAHAVTRADGAFESE